MDAVSFRAWLINNGVKSKVATDTVSRVKKLKKEINNCDIDAHYKRDRCAYLLSLFFNKGQNEQMQQYKNCALPIGKYTLSTYSYALRKYIAFRDATPPKS